MAREYINREDMLNTGREKLNRSIDKSYDAEDTSKKALDDANRLGNEAKQISTQKGNESISIANKKGDESIAIAKENEKISKEGNLIAKDTNDRMNQIIGGETDSAEIIDARKPLGLETATTLNERLNMQFGNNEDFRPEAISLVKKMKYEFDERAINITSFGADESKKDNFDSIQAAIDYCYSAGGGQVLVPSGVFKTSNKIQLKNSVSLKGVGKDASVLKIKDNLGNWTKLFEGGENSLLQNVSIEDLTFDCNTDNVVTTTNQWGDDSRVLLWLGENLDCEVSNCKFISNGVWAIRSKSQNGKFTKNDVYFDNTGLKSNFDISSFWIGNGYNIISQNKFININELGVKAVTAIETQGHDSFVTNNIITGYEAGIIFTNTTGYENKFKKIQLLGAVNSKIKDNIINVNNTGIDLWSMFKDGGNGFFKDIDVSGNVININNVENKDNGRSGIKTHNANPFSSNAVDRKQNSNFDGVIVKNNIVTFKNRTVSDSPSQGDVGIRFENICAVKNLIFSGNKISNAGFSSFVFSSPLLYKKDVDGNWIIDIDSNPNFQENLTIESNESNESLRFIHFARNVRDVKIINNVINQSRLYSNHKDNMLFTIFCDFSEFKNNTKYLIGGNHIFCPRSLKPFYPFFKGPSVNLLNFDDNSKLLDFPEMSFELPGKTNIIPYEKHVKLLNNTTVTALYKIWATRGDLNNHDGTAGVFVKEFVDEKTVRLSDATNVHPLQVLELSDDFTSKQAIVIAVSGNYVIVNGSIAPKPGKENNIIDKYVLKFYNATKTVS